MTYQAIKVERDRLIGFEDGDKIRRTVDPAELLESWYFGEQSLIDRHDDRGLLDLWNDIPGDSKGRTSLIAPTKSESAKKLWMYMCRTALSAHEAQIPEGKTRKRGRPRNDAHARGYLMLVLKPSDITFTMEENLPKQAISMIEIILEDGRERFTEDEMKAVIAEGAAAGQLKTKQDPWRIFQYYRPKLIQYDVLRQTNGDTDA